MLKTAEPQDGRSLCTRIPTYPFGVSVLSSLPDISLLYYAIKNLEFVNSSSITLTNNTKFTTYV